MKNTFIYTLLVAVMLVSFSCSDDEQITPDPTADLELIATTSIDNSAYTIKMFTADQTTLQVGYNHFYLAMYDENGDWLPDAHLTIMPMMNMMGDMPMQHSAPFEAHEHMHNGETLQSFATVFVMPSTDMGTWTLDITAMEQGLEFNGEATMNLTIANPEVATMKSLVGSDEASYFLSLVQPASPEVGENDLEFTLHVRESMMSWPGVEDLTIEIEPEMPSMGHGSPNNVHPTHDAIGHYLGKVNFTMTGEWVINVVIKNGETIIGETSIDITL